MSIIDSRPSRVFPEELHAVIKQQRELRGITKSEFARITGISTKTINKLEHGGDVKLSSFRTILSALGISFTLNTSTDIKPAQSSIQKKKRRCILTEEMKNGWF